MTSNNAHLSEHAGPICICGRLLTKVQSSVCYNGGGVCCDRCGETVAADAVYHCASGQCKQHDGGFDVCVPCGDALKSIKPASSTYVVVAHRATTGPRMHASYGASKRDEGVIRHLELWYWPNGAKQTEQESTQHPYASISRNLTSKYQLQRDFTTFNAKMATQGTASKETIEQKKFRENLSTKSGPGAIDDFPSLLAQIKQFAFGEHDKLKQTMNAYQTNEEKNDEISARRMQEKQNANHKWSVLGVIDPDKHLSTLEHGLQRAAADIANYHHWIPSVFQVNEQATECKLLSEIPNLNAYKYGKTLHKLMEKLFLCQLEQFENVTGYNLRNVPLQVVVKAQDYKLSDCSEEDSYLGGMHREGLFEDIAAVGLYYYHIDDEIKGGELELSAVVQANVTQYRHGITVLRETSVSVKEGMSLVFHNKLCYHRVSKLYGNGSRKIIAFFLITPNHLRSTPMLDALSIVVNWKYHTQYLVFEWLKEEGLLNGYEWMLDILREFVVGDKRYVEEAVELYVKCRKSYGYEISYNESEITSRGQARQQPQVRRRRACNRD